MNAFIWVSLATELGVLVYIAVYVGAYLEKSQGKPQATAALLVLFFIVWIFQLVFLVKKWQNQLKD
ncbi:MAG: hypothetical protein HAW63_00245 [Bdellovibrionaceae bacterium]|nr:hypothetical protein [Pseudobdellovibrionaceae bacterium]